jgi:hypothetical protein
MPSPPPSLSTFLPFSFVPFHLLALSISLLQALPPFYPFPRIFGLGWFGRGIMGSLPAACLVMVGVCVLCVLVDRWGWEGGWHSKALR